MRRFAMGPGIMTVQRRQPKGLSCVNGYGIVAFMPMGREKHKMSRSFVIPKHIELFCQHLLLTI